MKKLFTGITMMLISLSASATIFYIDPHGSNTNNGTSTGTPWKTLTYACAHATTSGDIIHVNVGTYIETVQSVLAVGVSIEGTGVTSYIYSTITSGTITSHGIADSASFTIKLSSPSQGTNGNQHISNIEMDGDSLTADAAIIVYQRSNVEISNCTFINFHYKGIGFQGFVATASGRASPPTTYATGNKFHDNIVTNCSGVLNPGNKKTNTALYSLSTDGQDSLLVYNNTLDQSTRALGYNGFVIDGVTGYNENLKIYNNTITRKNQGDFTLSWDFAIELWNCRGGVEIYDNTISGSIDIGGYYTQKTSYAYAVSIHDNTIGQDNLHVSAAYIGITLEADIEYINVVNNIIKNVATGIEFSLNGTAITANNISIYDNLIDSIGVTTTSGSGVGINWSSDHSTSIVSNINIWNNTIIGYTGTHLSNLGIRLPDIGTAHNVSVRNNIIQNFSNYPIYAKASAGQTIDNLSIENNIFYKNGNGNFPLYIAIIPTHNTTQNNLITNPLCVSSSDFHLQVTSPAINAGIDVGLPFTGSAPDIGAYEYSNRSSPGMGVNAGNDTTLILPINNTTLTGSIVNPGRTISYEWTKISGPTSYNIVNASSPVTDVTGLVQGVYKFELKVTDNNGETGLDTVKITVNAAANIPCVANAGQDQTIILPTNTVSLSGSGIDPDGSIASYNWKKISGPSTDTITNANTAATSVTGLVRGVYQFELKVTDNKGAVGKDTMQVTVNAVAIKAGLLNATANQPPTANSGGNQTIILPINTVALNGSGKDINGTVVIFFWRKISGPSSGIITNANSATTTVSEMVQGVYQFELKVTDNKGVTGRDTMQVTVNEDAIANIAPVANAGSSSTITLPVNTTSLAGSSNDADGTIVSYLWTKISGPKSYNIVNASSPVTDASGLVQGVYKFELKVTDNNGATGKDTMQVTVNADADIAPVANAGLDQAITLPTNTALLNGSGTDVDGTISGYSWKQISGPLLSGIISPNAPITLSINLVAGTYEFELSVTDNSGTIGRDTVVVVVGVEGHNLDVQSSTIKIYPNPVVDIATLEINPTQANSKLLVVITNMQGQIILKTELASGQNNIQDKINISNLSKGTYAVTVYFSDQEKQTIKVMKM
jgi:hypothetical protein